MSTNKSTKRQAPTKRTDGKVFTQGQMAEMFDELTVLRAKHASLALSEGIEETGAKEKRGEPKTGSTKGSKKAATLKAAAALPRTTESDDDEETEDSEEEYKKHKKRSKTANKKSKREIRLQEEEEHQASPDGNAPVLARLDGIMALLSEQGKGEGELRSMLVACETEIYQCRSAQSLSSYQNEATSLQVINQFEVSAYMRMLLKLVSELRGHMPQSMKAAKGQSKKERDIEEIVKAATTATEKANDMVMVFGQADFFWPKLVAEYTKNGAAGAGHSAALDAAKTSCSRDPSGRHFDHRGQATGSGRSYHQQSGPQQTQHRPSGNQDRSGWPATTVNASGWQPASLGSGSGGNFHYGPAESQLVVQGTRRDGGGGGGGGGGTRP
jgi:hypothetical protein